MPPTQLKMETADFGKIDAIISGIAKVQVFMGDDYLKTCLYTTGILQSDDLHLLQGEALFTAATEAVIRSFGRF